MQQTKKVSKTLLRNLIRQTETHNRIVEEEECWRQYDVLQASESIRQSHGDAQHRHDSSSQLRSRLTSESSNGADDDGKYVSRRPKCCAHMDDVDEVQPRVYNDRHGERRETHNFWLRQLDAAESSDPNRWGHSGYKELYPQDFASPPVRHDTSLDLGTDVDQSMPDNYISKTSAKKLKHKKKSSHVTDKHKKKKKKKKHKKKRSSSESSAACSEHRTEAKKRKRKSDGGPKKKKKKKRHDD